MQKITPCLWFDTQAEEAINYYVDMFNGAPNKTSASKIISIARYEPGMEVPGGDKLVGKVITAIFELAGQRFMCLDGGPLFKFTEAVSLEVECSDQAEVDYFWGKLSAVPASDQCGWVKDKFGVSWQIMPSRLGELLSQPDKKKSLAVMNAVLKMKKIIIDDLEKAAE